MYRLDISRLQVASRYLSMTDKIFDIVSFFRFLAVGFRIALRTGGSEIGQYCDRYVYSNYVAVFLAD